MQVYTPSGGSAGGGVAVASGSPINPKIWMGTTAQRDAIPVKDSDTVYVTTD